jgi:predicted anti-sigma-YlaC factor YlaD
MLPADDWGPSPDRGVPAEMLTCRAIAAAVTDYLEGDLRATDRWLFRAHLALCGDCRRHVRKMRELVLALGRLPAGEVPPELTQTFRVWHRG